MLSRDPKIASAEAAARQPDDEVSDQELVQLVRAMKVATNCDGAAQFYFALVSAICYQRPQLAERLLLFPLEPLRSLGFTRAQEVFAYVTGTLQSGFRFAPSWLEQQAGPHGLVWLTTELPQLGPLVDATLVRLEEDDSFYEENFGQE